MGLESPAAIRAIFDDAWKFSSRLHVKDETNTLHELSGPWPEQIPWIQALLGPKKYVIGLKPRQVGYTTWATAWLFWKTYTSRHPQLAMQIVHDPDAFVRVRDMANVFREELPEEIRAGTWRGHDNAKETLWGHNHAGLVRRIAGAKGKGRSGTINHLHATEVAFWAAATSAGRRDETGGDDQTMWSSALASMHDADGRVIVESTGNGPRGLFHRLWKESKTDPKWSRVFVPWNTVPRYSELLTDLEARALEQDLDDLEKKLVAEFRLSMGQIAWRRTKMRTEMWDPLRFRREFPLTDLEPFMFSESGWFNQDLLSVMKQWAPEVDANSSPLRVFADPIPGMRYFLGCDTSGGVGRDWSVIHILDVNLRHCAVWATNLARPDEQAQMVSRLGAIYNRATALIEANKYGEKVIERVRLLGGCDLWVDPDAPPESDGNFYSTGASAGSRKRALYVNAREVIESQWAVIQDPLTIDQAQTIVEKLNGAIEAAGTHDHDDHIDAYALALYAAKDAWRQSRIVVDEERDRIRAIQERMRRSRAGHA